LTNIKQQTFQIAESNTEFIKILLDYDGASEVFVNSPQFLAAPSETGATIQKSTYLGRFLSFSALTTETQSWR
tara:strand:+ start:847 stop:1065 length:219 start_codon:yes stop_codon:yes gene_type:complete